MENKIFEQENSNQQAIENLKQELPRYRNAGIS